MAAHVRKQIRDRVVTDITGLTTTGSNVHSGRVWALKASDLPALVVYTLSEESEPETMDPPRTVGRTLEVVIQAEARATSDLDDTLDTICKEVEEALADDESLNGLAKESHLMGTEQELIGEGDNEIGVARMTYAVIYMTLEDAPDAAV